MLVLYVRAHTFACVVRLTDGPKTQDADVVKRINDIYNPPPPPPPANAKGKRGLRGGTGGTTGDGAEGVAPTGCCTIS
jgi:hypothetical protein